MSLNTQYTAAAVDLLDRAAQARELKPQFDAAAEDELPRSRLLTLGQIAALPPPTWLVDGLIPRGVLAGIYGPSGTCKSFMALDWALTIATGAGSWYGRATESGPVVYIAAEGYRNFEQRGDAWQVYHQRTNVEGFTVWPQEVNLMDPVAVAEFLTDPGFPAEPALIVVDTLARCMVGGDENSAKDMGLLINGAEQIKRATGATVLIVHHTGVAEGRERGSTALRAAVDTMIAQSKDDGIVTLACIKQKDAEEFEASAWQVTTVADTNSIILAPADVEAQVSAHAPVSNDQRVVLTFLSSPMMDGGAGSDEIAKGTQLPATKVYKALAGLIKRAYLDFEGPPRSKARRFWPTTAGRAAVGLTSNTSNTSTTLPSREEKSAPTDPDSLSSNTSTLHRSGSVEEKRSQSGPESERVLSAEQEKSPAKPNPKPGNTQPAAQLGACRRCGCATWLPNPAGAGRVLECWDNDGKCSRAAA